MNVALINVVVIYTEIEKSYFIQQIYKYIKFYIKAKIDTSLITFVLRVLLVFLIAEAFSKIDIQLLIFLTFHHIY